MTKGPSIQAETDPNIPFPRQTFWLWETMNIVIPLIGILFLDWHIFTLVILFWWELFCWGCVGILKMLSAHGGGDGLAAKIVSRILAIAFFTPLYLGLFMIILTFSFTEFDTESMLDTDRGLIAAMIMVAVNYFIEYVRSELVTWRFLIRNPYEIIMERIIYALPLGCLILFAVIPLSQRFEGAEAEKIIGVGILISKFIIDVAAHYLPGIMITFNDMEEQEDNVNQDY